ncbi:hypothetical protein B0J12DRAFT_688651 [Macrophomina phaseolina]|uniref:Copper amine oxidase N2-terminal domain-containing protein n=1 Tax=Macrophomina phaseolina TaxID=35725 RepID=A0ABQ8FRM0_9PEZI|nr:hypothetical protein B0J12DRAFT_688651 [Macrophomina phaseolina]
MLPNKTDALKYLDNKGQGPRRYALAVLNMAATTEPYYQDLIVGPPPIRNGATGYRNLTYPLYEED